MRPVLASARTSLLPVLAIAAALLPTAPLAAQERPVVPIPPDHWTQGELDNFRSTPSYDRTLAFLRRLEQTSPYLSLSFYGTSAEGRPMPVVVASKEKAFTPEAAAKSGKPVVLVLNGIHSGEIDGKDACLILLRDMAL
ncbi:MAG TPA: M14 family zinc carboxypeptidase, partial [Thermoanaerobaculia bacterium]|nr:M14 family zinc carboxypeptidase [Thermoanaerobaculia bacterium]